MKAASPIEPFRPNDFSKTRVIEKPFRDTSTPPENPSKCFLKLILD